MSSKEPSFLQLSNWWGLSNTPGNRTMYLNEDGSYLIEVETQSHKKNKKNNLILTTEKIICHGNINEDRMNNIKNFLQQNITKYDSKMMFDAGYTIKLKTEDKVLEVKNNDEIWNMIVELIPEYKQDLGDSEELPPAETTNQL